MSYSEHVVGKWIDGKPLYEKTISVGALPNTASKSTAHSISNIGVIWITNGFADDGSNVLVLPYAGAALTDNIPMYVNRTNVVVITYANKSSYVTTYITVRYTKSTD